MSDPAAEKKLTLPTIHHNGTGRAGLTLLNTAAGLAVQSAIEAVSDAAPHGRDYYPQDDGVILGPVYARARREHEDRLARLRSVLAELRQVGDFLAQDAA